MKKRLAVFLGALLLSPVVALAGEAAGECKSFVLGDIRIELDGNGMVQVPVRFEGRDVWMVLAMSSGVPMLYEGAVQELALADRLVPTQWEMSFGGKPIRSQVSAKSLRLGGADFTGWNLQVLPENSPPVVFRDGKPVIGVLTSAFMKAVDVEFDFAARQMRLFRYKDCKGPPAHWQGEATSTPLYSDVSGLLAFTMELDGKKVESSLNTASSRSVLSSRVSREHFGFDETSPDISKETVGLDQEVVSFRAMSLTAEGLNIRNTPVALRTGDTCRISSVLPVRTGSRTAKSRSSGSIGYANCLGRTPLSIGTGVLMRLRVYFASKEAQIYFQSSGPTTATQ